MFLGADAFIQSSRRKVPKGRDLRENPQSKGRATAKPLSYYVHRYADRDHELAAAYATGSYTTQNTGGFFGLHYSRVSKILRTADKARAGAQGKT